MQKVTYTITAERVFVLTKAVSDGAAGSCGAIAELHSLDDALAVAKALQTTTPGAELHIRADDVPKLTQEMVDMILGTAIQAAHGVAVRSSHSEKSAAESVVNASLSAAETISRRASV